MRTGDALDCRGGRLPPARGGYNINPLRRRGRRGTIAGFRVRAPLGTGMIERREQGAVSSRGVARRRTALWFCTTPMIGATALVAGFAWRFPGEAVEVARFLRPWEFSPTVLAACLLLAGFYANGQRRARRHRLRPGLWRPLSFWLGLALIYFMLQSRVDYFAQHMFFIHRLQHLMLHHLAPFLLVLANPLRMLLRGVPAFLRKRMMFPVLRNGPLRLALGSIQRPLPGALLFVGLVYFWLVPSIHFDAMLSIHLYKAMSWSMVLDGALFWWLMLDPTGRGRARLSYGRRMLTLWLIMIPQILLGAFMALSRTDLYPIYKLCGRAFAVSPLFDQHMGGLLIWIPGSMMSLPAALIVLALWRRRELHAGSRFPQRGNKLPDGRLAV